MMRVWTNKQQGNSPIAWDWPVFVTQIGSPVNKWWLHWATRWICLPNIWDMHRWGHNEETINKHHIYEDGCAVRIFGGKLSPVKQSSWLQTWSFGSYVWFFACIGKTLQFADEIVTWNTDQGNAWHWKAVRSDTKYWSNMTRVWKRGESTPELWPFCWFGKMM